MIQYSFQRSSRSGNAIGLGWLAARKGFVVGLLAFLAAYFGVSAVLKLNPLAHSPYDSYTLQAMAWRGGQLALDGNREWLELAVYEGRYYVSFPPFPAVPMLLLTFLFGEKTPSALVVLAYYVVAYGFAYKTARRYLSDISSAAFAFFLAAGCSFFEVAMYGGVWNMAQILSFMLMMICVYGVTSDAAGWRRAGLFCLALAVGCRPFQIVYAPLALYCVYQRLSGSFGRRLSLLALDCVAPFLIGCGYAAYNFLRFGDIFEFGHNYLPEFSRDGQTQFSIAHVLPNLKRILRMPTFEDGWLTFPKYGGWAFWLCNPIFVLFGGRLARAALERRASVEDWLALGLCAAHFFLLLLHRTLGGWQYGTRYLCDLMPFMFWCIVNKSGKIRALEALLMLAGVGLAIYGAARFHFL